MNPTLKIVLVGDESVGKTALIHKLLGEDLFEEYQPTLTGAYFQLQVTDTIKIDIWDTAGQEKYRRFPQLYFRDVSCILIVCALNSRRSFEDIQFWLSYSRDHAPNSKYLVIGNKSDLVEERIVKSQEFQTFCNEANVPYIETSAQTGFQIHQLLELIMEVEKTTSNTEIRPTGLLLEENRGKGFCC